MNSQQLMEFVDEVIAFLTTLDEVVPNKVDEELLAFFRGIKSTPWVADILVNLLGQKKAAPARTAR